ncbi:MAG TPA: hypothetical protein V6C65_33145 [Allocoleopsis sp.]
MSAQFCRVQPDQLPFSRSILGTAGRVAVEQDEPTNQGGML